MLKTLNYYLWRELLKITLLGLIVFTLIMTVFAIVEPLRKQGLSSDYIVLLFGYTIPVMLSLTLPIAALFAATMVYGRFSQDNELTACRASGISTFSILKPAITLGVIITIATLVLSNYVAPRLAGLLETAVKANIRGIITHQLLSQGYIRYENNIIHADRLGKDKKTIYGVAFARNNAGKIDVGIAAKASIDFKKINGKSYVVISCYDVYGPFSVQHGLPLKSKRAQKARKSSNSGSGGFAKFALRVPDLAREKVTFYQWDKLLSTLNKPEGHKEIRDELKDIRRKISYHILAADVANTIKDGEPYNKFVDEDGNKYSIRAPSVKVTSQGIATLSSGKDKDGEYRKVSITVFLPDGRNTFVTADNATVEASIPPMSAESMVTISLTGKTLIKNTYEGSIVDQNTVSSWQRGQIQIPQNVQEEASAIGLDELFHRAGDITSNQFILKEIEILKTEKVGKIKRDIIAEIHGRLAYGVSCFLLVGIGASLGLLFRGGQVVSAFALAMAPATLVIIMIIMGKNLVTRQEQGSSMTGLIVIWGGDVLLLAIGIFTYRILGKR